MAELTPREKAALRYYIGDVSGTDPFHSDPKAYVVLNSLFFAGTAAERARAAEGKRLNPAILADTDRLTELFAGLFSAFRRCTAEKELRTFRVERWSDYALCKAAGATLSLTSTSTAGFLSEYRDRLGIALMRFTLPKGTPCIDVAAALDFYAKPEEAEVLLPPFLRLDIAEVPVTDDERGILDSAGEPPRCSCTVTTNGIQPCTAAETELPHGGGQAGQRVLAALNAGALPSPADEELYSRWKRAYLLRLHRLFTE
ncbi:MAG: hypothetical protein IKP78_09130 [Ruminococcus sp.]|nr:hypothetical protein [Ruminococcus sp.]